MALSAKILGNPLSVWLSVFSIALLVWIALLLTKRLLVHRLKTLAQQTANYWFDLLVALLMKFGKWFLLFIGCQLASQLLFLPHTYQRFWKSALVIIIALQTIVWGNAIIAFFFGGKGRLASAALGESAVGVIGYFARFVLWSLVLLITLGNLGFNVTAVLTGLGVGGIAVALASQKILGDVFSSFIIVFDKPFEIGDFITIGDFAGTVEKVGLKTTRLRSLTGEQIVMANSDLIESRLRNYKRMTERRVKFLLRVTYETPLATLERIPDLVREIVEVEAKCRFEHCALLQFGDSSLDFETVYYILDDDYEFYAKTHHHVNLEIVRQFGEEGIAFAYPTRTLHHIQARTVSDLDGA